MKHVSAPLSDDGEFRVILGRTRIEFDPRKEERNRRKHGYSLLSAVHFLEGLAIPGSRRLLATRIRRHDGELRHEHMTTDDSGNVVFFVTTMREAEVVRVISLRVASEAERAIFSAAISLEIRT